MAGDGLGFSGSGAGMFNSLFDAGLDFGKNLGTQFVKTEFGQPVGVNQATRLGLTPGQLSVVNYQTPQGATIGGIDQKTILVGVALLIGAIVMAKVL